MRTSALFASLLAGTLMSCGGQGFNEPWRLDKPRILAIRADPPQPSFGVTTNLSTLLYQPPAERQCPVPGPTTYKWSWCPIGMIADSATNTFKCPFPEEGFRQLYAAAQQAYPGLPDAPPYELGYGETLSFTNPFPAPLLYALCRGDIGSMLGGAGEGGQPASGSSVFSCDLPASDVAANVNIQNSMETHPIGMVISIKVEVTPACPDLLPAGFSPLIGLYSLHLPTNDAIPVNQNPVISGIFARENVVGILDGGTTTPAPSGGELDGGIPPGDIDGGAGQGDFDGGAGPGDLDGGGAGDFDGGTTSPDVGAGKTSHDGPDGSVTLQEDPVVEVKRDKHVGLTLDIDISTAEHLPVPGRIDYTPVTQTQDIALTRHYEHLGFTWFAEAGDFTGEGKGSSTGYLPEAIPDTQPDIGPSPADIANFQFNTTNNWDLPRNEDYGYKTARIIVVVRDGRGGVDWISKQVTLEDKP